MVSTSLSSDERLVLHDAHLGGRTPFGDPCDALPAGTVDEATVDEDDVVHVSHGLTFLSLVETCREVDVVVGRALRAGPPMAPASSDDTFWLSVT